MANTLDGTPIHLKKAQPFLEVQTIYVFSALKL